MSNTTNLQTHTVQPLHVAKRAREIPPAKFARLVLFYSLFEAKGDAQTNAFIQSCIDYRESCQFLKEQGFPLVDVAGEDLHEQDEFDVFYYLLQYESARQCLDMYEISVQATHCDGVHLTYTQDAPTMSIYQAHHIGTEAIQSFMHAL